MSFPYSVTDYEDTVTRAHRSGDVFVVLENESLTFDADGLDRVTLLDGPDVDVDGGRVTFRRTGWHALRLHIAGSTSDAAVLVCERSCLPYGRTEVLARADLAKLARTARWFDGTQRSMRTRPSTL